MFLKFNANVCRVCLEQEGNVSLLSKKEIADQFSFCTLLEVSKNDDLPSSLCTKCFKCLKIANDFKTKAISSDNYIRKFLQTLNKKISTTIANNRDTLNIDIKELNSLLSLSDNDDEIVNSLDTSIEKNSQDPIAINTTRNVDPIAASNEKPNYKIEIIKFNGEEFTNCGDVDRNDDDDDDHGGGGVEEQHSTHEEIIEEVICEDENYQIINNGDDKAKKRGIFLINENNDDEEYHSTTESSAHVAKRRTLRNRYRTENADNTQALRDSSSSPSPSQCVCVECNRTFSSKPNLMRHILTHTNARPFQCTICGGCFTQNGSLKTHMLRHTGERPFKCEVCDKTFTRKRSLRVHMRIHTGDKPYQCDHCGERFRIKEALKRHNTTKHLNEPPKEFPCSICERILSSKFSLEMHLKLHRGEQDRKVSCNICNKEFSTKYSLQHHLKTHSNDQINKLYKCKECNNEFKTRSDYIIHLQKHQTNKNNGSKTTSTLDLNSTTFICEVCHQVVARKFQLIQHLLTHEDETNINYSCRRCGKGFTIKENLLEHLRNIHNDCIFKCEECNVGFNVKRDLKLHRVNFHKEIIDDLNTCDDCGVKFVTSSDLNVHIVTKHDAIDIECEECGRYFTSKKLYKKHSLEHEIIEQI